MTSVTRMPVRWSGDYRHSALILGTAQFAAGYGIANTTGQPGPAAVAEILRTAEHAGVTHVDTARAYGVSEERVGAALRTAPSTLDIVTKVAPLPSDEPITAARAGQWVEDSVRESLDRLGRSRPATVLLHRRADALIAGGAAWNRLREFVAAGTVDRIGVSVASPADVASVLDLPGLGYLQVPCNIVDWRWADHEVTAALSRRTDVVVVARSVYLQGLLTAGSELPWPHLDDRSRDLVVGRLDRLAEALGRAGRRDLCLAYVLSLPWVTAAVVGAETPSQVLDNTDLAARAPLNSADRAEASAAIAALRAHLPERLLDPSTWG